MWHIFASNPNKGELDVTAVGYLVQTAHLIDDAENRTHIHAVLIHDVPRVKSHINLLHEIHVMNFM